LCVDSGEHNLNSSSVREYAYEEDKNMRFRPQMEDTYCIMDKVAGDQTCGMFAIFDGHGGKQVSDHCAERFPTEFRKEMQKNPSDLHKPLTDIFAKVCFPRTPSLTWTLD
jgi:serine/threonine protein phosphatase PrpC